jgi:[lysine-biosynthesis-protein LysW]---L-2-aminoadipate ligase
MPRIVLVHSRVRAEERLLLEAAERLSFQIEPVNDAELVLDIHGERLGADAVLTRSVSATRTLALLRFCRAHGIPAVNPYEVAAACVDKAETSLRLAAHKVPTPATRVAFTPEAAMRAIEEIGYPAVLKPVVGSWARLVARVDDRVQAEQILEHREALPNPQQHVYYVQRYIDKNQNGRHHDLRTFVVGDEVIAGIRLVSPHWVTNTARGAVAEPLDVRGEVEELSLRAAEAVGGGILAIDLMEGPDGMVVHEVNHTMEFRNSIQPTGVDIPGRILQHVVEVARR